MVIDFPSTEHVAQREKTALEELIQEARMMTRIGLSGEDIRDPYTALLVSEGLSRTQTLDELKSWIQIRRKPNP